jgi:A/G-specific adenine glycosylase
VSNRGVDLAALRRWFRPRRAAYPWRVDPDPYRVWVSEVMLQQTQAVRVVPAYPAFLERFPSVEALARASRGDVLRAWSGLGYNRRAVALSEAARAIVREHGGVVPDRAEDLRRLPGIGLYTAAAVASLGYGRPVPALDTNVRRVLARHRLGVEPSQAANPALERAAHRWLDRRRPGEWNQALMDLGREICRPVPRCPSCPLASGCRFKASGRRGGYRRRPQPRFDGSFRQLRGAVLRVLLERSPRTVGEVARALSRPDRDVASAIAALHRDGLVRAGPAALAGRAGGRVRLSR